MEDVDGAAAVGGREDGARVDVIERADSEKGSRCLVWVKGGNQGRGGRDWEWELENAPFPVFCDGVGGVDEGAVHVGEDARGFDDMTSLLLEELLNNGRLGASYWCVEPG